MTAKMTQPDAYAGKISGLTLGKAVSYTEHYAPQLLQAVPRSLNREDLAITQQQPFTGEDIWNGYELSWLNEKGKPNIAIMCCSVPYDSPNLIESKSFKLYLNSFNQTKVATLDELQQMLERDLSQCAGKQVTVSLYTPKQFSAFQVQELEGECLDELDIEVEHYSPQQNMLQTSSAQVTETLCSHLLKSNCLITSQPDWASIQIRYQGNKIDRQALLKYLISFRSHNEFHEQCVERIFCDILTQCKPDKLTVYARYTRRGGLDINPFRSNFETRAQNTRLARQ